MADNIMKDLDKIKQGQSLTDKQKEDKNKKTDSSKKYECKPYKSDKYLSFYCLKQENDSPKPKKVR